MEKEFQRAGANRRRHQVTVHWSDAEFYQLLRACPISQPLSAFIRQIVGEWAIAQAVPLADPPDSWYDDAESERGIRQDNPEIKANKERTHYQSPKKGGSFHGPV